MLKGHRYCFMRLGFGLNVVPLIMRSIMNSVISQDTAIQRARFWFIDDVFINTHLASPGKVKEHLAKFELACKTPERLQEGAEVLWLDVQSDGGRLRWTWRVTTPDSLPVITQQTNFSVCEKLVGHFPICRWLRMATAYQQHCTNKVTTG